MASHWGFVFLPPPKIGPPQVLRDGALLSHDIFFYGYFDYSEHVFSVGLMLKAPDRLLHHPKVAQNA